MRKENTSKNTINLISKLILKNKPKNVLDIPCGTGILTEKLLANHIEVTSSDINNIIKAKNSKFIKADMDQNLDFEDESFDLIACVDGIEHIKKQFDFVSNCKRILKKNGKLLISTPNISSLRSRFRYLLTGFHNKCKVPLDENNPNPLHHINMISYPELRYMLHTNGFEVEEIQSNRYKAIALLYAPLIPLVSFVTKRVFRRELKNESEVRVGEQVKKQMMLPSILFGETLVIIASKTK